MTFIERGENLDPRKGERRAAKVLGPSVFLRRTHLAITILQRQHVAHEREILSVWIANGARTRNWLEGGQRDNGGHVEYS
jgi:hypothetical protein